MDELVKLKAEAFDLLLEKENFVKRIDFRLQEIYARIGELQEPIPAQTAE